MAINSAPRKPASDAEGWPIKRRDLISGLRKAGFVGPEPGGRYGVMRRGDVTIPIPNPHHGDISKPFLLHILDEAGISREEWEAL